MYFIFTMFLYYILFYHHHPYIGSDMKVNFYTYPHIHYYISIQNPTEKSNGTWISLFKLTKNHKDTFFFVNMATTVA